jgi:CRISPR-associated protein Cmr6
MVRPLYQPSDAVTPSRDSRGHAGLWYDKFCDQWRLPTWTLQEGKSEDKGSNPKLDWINNLTGQPLGVANELEEITKRLIRLSVQQGGLSLVFRTESRYVTGLGRSHPVENGFAWHPTLGTPYLPGSSIKGMVRAWATQTEPSPDQATLTRVFGAPGQSGGLCFLDAVPIAPAKVEADVLTPHYAAWSPDKPPGDWRSPVPVPFLVTAEGLGLLFTVVPCGPLCEGDLEQVEAWLIEALAWAGAGAKTAVGYGRMRLDRQKSDELITEERQCQEQKQQSRRQAERLASLDPLDRELEELAANEAPTSPPPPPYRAWFKAVENGHWSDDPKSARLVLDRIEAAMRLAGDWKEISGKKNQNKPDKKYALTQKVKQLKAQLAS